MRLKYRFAVAVILALVLGGSVRTFAHDKITTIAGGPPDGIHGFDTNIPAMQQIAQDAEGNIYMVSEGVGGSALIFKLSHGILTRIAGDSTYVAFSDSRSIDSFHGDTGLATQIEMSGLNGIAVDNAVPANVYISVADDCIVLKLDQSTGQIAPFYGPGGFTFDGGCPSSPQGIAADPRNGDVYVSQTDGGIALVPGPTSSSVGRTFDSFIDCSGGNYSYGGPAFCSDPVALDTSVTPANIYIGLNCHVDEIIGSTGVRYTVAGSTTGCGYVDNVPALQGQFNNIQQVSVNASNGVAVVRVADMYNAAIREFSVASLGGIPQSGVVTTVAGGLSCNSASPVALNSCVYPVGIASDIHGGYLIANGFGEVDDVSVSGAFSKVIAFEPVPNYAPLYSNPRALQNSLIKPLIYSPGLVYADPDSVNVFMGGGSTSAIYVRNETTNRISGFVGNGGNGLSGDNEVFTAPDVELNSPNGMTKDAAGNLFIADTGNCRIRRIDAGSGILSTFAGTTCGYSGDGGPALEAQFSYPASVAFDAQGNLFIADVFSCAIRRIDAHTRIITTVAGGLPVNQCLNYPVFSGDGGPAAQASLATPGSVSVDRRGNIFIADTGNGAIREIFADTGIIQTVAGIGGNPGYNGDSGFDGSGNATQVQLSYPSSVKVDANGNLFIADTGNEILRWVTPAGQVVTFAGAEPPDIQGGNGGYIRAGFAGDGGLALYALLNNPLALDQDSLGNFVFADAINNRIRQVSAFPGYGMSASSLTFTPQKVGTTSVAQTILVSAIGPLKIGPITVGHGFTESNNCAYTVLSTGQTCSVSIVFQPKMAGTFDVNLRIYSNALLKASPDPYSGLDGNPDTVSLSGSTP